MKKSSIKGLFFACAAVLMTSSAGAVVFSDAVAEEAGTQTQTFLSSDLIMPGAAVRIEDDGKNGIRFPVRLTPETYNKFKGEITESGTLIVPKSLYNDGELVLENVGKSGYDTDKRVTTNNWKAITEKDDEGVEHSYMQTLIYAYNIPEENLNEEFCVRGYVIIDGEVIYSSTVERSMTSVAEQALPDYVKDSEKTGLLQSYIKYDVTFDAANGTETTTQLVGYNGKATEPDAPEAPQSYAFSHWALNGEEYDFNSVVTGDITLTAVYEQISRYEVLLGDGSGTGWGFYDATKYGAWETTYEYTQYENNDVMAMTSTAGSTNPNYFSTFTRTNEELLKTVSTKGYIGYRVYAEKGAWIHTELTSNAGEKKTIITRILPGWNEIVIDLAAIHPTVNAENPLKTFAIGLRCNTEWLSTGTATVYFDDIYATNYPVSDTVDFESKGDMQRFTVVSTSQLYAQTRYNTNGTGNSGDITYEEIDGENAIKVTPRYLYSQLNFLTYSGALFNKTITDYSKIEVRVRVNSEDARLAVSLGAALAETQIVDGSTQAGEWVTYQIPTTGFTTGNLSFKLTDASGDSENADVWFWIDYIKFVK